VILVDVGRRTFSPTCRRPGGHRRAVAESLNALFVSPDGRRLPGGLAHLTSDIMIRRRFGRCSCLLIPAALLVAAPAARAVTLGMADTFQTGTSLGWGGAGVQSVANAGPQGAGDFALEVLNGSRGIATYNETQWKGNYVAAGVATITMDVRNPNAYDLKLRLGFSGGDRPGPMGSGPTYVTSLAQTVAPGAWQQVTFAVTPADFIAASTNTEAAPNVTAALGDVRHFRVFHQPTNGLFTAAGIGSMRLDNITASGGAADDADFDQDGDVDGADLLQWQRGVGVGTTQVAGDADGDGSVDGDDLAIWKSQFAGAGTASAATAVPEPAGWIVAAGLAGAVQSLDRRRRNHEGTTGTKKSRTRTTIRPVRRVVVSSW
jgi:hypothetical protein